MYTSTTHNSAINIPTSDFTKGIYFISISQGEETEVQKIAVK
jgi:hypothetical protein